MASVLQTSLIRRRCPGALRAWSFALAVAVREREIVRRRALHPPLSIVTPIAHSHIATCERESSARGVPGIGGGSNASGHPVQPFNGAVHITRATRARTTAQATLNPPPSAGRCCPDVPRSYTPIALTFEEDTTRRLMGEAESRSIDDILNGT